MPSAINLKKLTASNWSAEKEDSGKAAPEGDSKPKKKSSWSSRVDAETILDAKRKRSVPADEQHLTDWIKENFEAKEDGYLSSRKMYDFYTEFCVLQNFNVQDQTLFNRRLNKVLGGKKFLIKDGSSYKGRVSEKKKEDKEKKSVKKSESISAKLNDIVIEALTEGKSPKKGLRFQWIKQYIIAKYPALRIDLKPNLLKFALERTVKYGYVELVRGIGLVGFYRLPGEYPEEDEDDKKKKAKKRSKKPKPEEEKKEENGAKEGEESKEGEEGKEKEVNGKTEEGDGEKKKDVSKAKKKKSSKKRPRRRPYFESVSRHVEPRTIEDTFPMAMTFMCEPKEASGNKIRRYIKKYFPSVDLETNFKKTLLNGCDKGLWDQMTGTGTSGSFRLQVDDINPLDCTNLEDMICLAILACHEPKQTSVNLLKQYIMEYHPNFNIDKRPYWFKKALEKAQNKGNIIRLTGIGSTGSFQLSDPFTPSPNWLGGEDESDIDEVMTEVVAEQEPAYKARPSRRRGMGRVAAASGRQPDFISYASVKSKTKKRRKPKTVYKEESDVEESEEEEAQKQRPKSRSKKAAKTSRGRKAKPVAESSGDEADEDEDEEPAEYTPRKSSSRGGTKSSTSREKRAEKQVKGSKKKGNTKTAAKMEEKRDRKQPKSNKRSKSSRDESDEESDEEIVEETKSAPKKQKRESKSPQKKSSSRSPSKGKSNSRDRRRSAKYDDSEEEGEVRSKSPRKKTKVNYGEQDSDEDDRPRKSQGKASRRSRAFSDSEEEEGEVPERSRKRSYVEEDDESLSELEVEVVPSKSKSKRGTGKKAAAEPMYSDSEDDGEVKSKGKRVVDSEQESDEEPPPKPTKSTKTSPKKSKKRR